MKTLSNFKKTLIISGIAIISSGILSSCSKDNDNTVNNTAYTITGNTSGTQVVPSVTGSGTATISGTYDPGSHMLTYTSTWTGLSGAPSSAGFYTGATGVNGTATGDSWSLGTGLSGTGTFSSTRTLTDEEANQLINGNWYYSYGTTTNPSGEVRGQVTASR